MEMAKVNGMDRYYQLLGLNPGASEEEIKEAYKRMVKVWDAERFPNDSKMQKMVNERLKEIDEAYKNLLLFLSGHYNKGETELPELQSEEGNKRAEGMADFAVQMEIQESTVQKKQISRQKVPYDPSYPPDWVDPNEPLSESERERSTKTEGKFHDGFQPPPKQPFGQSLPNVNPTRQEKQKVSYFPLMIFFMTIGGAIGKSITNFMHFSTDEAFLYRGGIPALLGGIGGLIAVGIVKIINGMEKPRKQKIRLAWGVAVAGGFLFPLTFAFILSPFLEHRQTKISSSFNLPRKPPPIEKSISQEEPPEKQNSQKPESKRSPFLVYLKDLGVPKDMIWKRIAQDNEGSTFSYDTKYSIRPVEGKVVLYTRTVYGPKAITRIMGQLGNDYEKLKFSLEFNDINCALRMARRIEVLHYSEEGLLLGYSETPSEWTFIPPNTFGEMLFQEVCR